MQYEYFYGAQAEQFSFYRIPKALFTEPNFRELSTDAKVLYGILLDRMSLSLKNQWLDKKLIFSIELDGKTYDKREDAGKALLGLVGAAVRATKPVPVGHYAGFEITVEYKPLEKVFHAHLVGEATHTTELGNDAAGNMIRFQNVVSALPQDLNRLHGSLEQLTKQLTNAEEELKQPFLQEQELSDKSARLAELDALLNVGNDAPIIEGEAEELEEEPEDALIQSDDELER